MTQVPPSLVRALSAPIPAVATDRGAVIVTPTGVLELRQLARGAWEWVGEDARRSMLVRPTRA